ncbi:type IV secretion system DNA-binding domain-containing protein [Cronobacter sakazakii]|nr:type IV secretion system DNA-binding domain-containing protein [Cronobacter sakazakii]
MPNWRGLVIHRWGLSMSNEMARNAGTHRLCFLVFLASPFVGWLATAQKMHYARETKPKVKGFIELFPHTMDYPLLITIPIIAMVVAILFWIIAIKLNKSEFRGYKYKYRLRGSELVSASALNNKTTERKKQQVTLATIKMPTSLENLQTLIVGAIGSAKTVTLSYAIYTIMMRGDRQIIVDPDGTFASMFYKSGDVILNAYDARSPGWTIFNEMRRDYDFDTYAYSLVPLGKSSTEEEWNAYGRLLVSEVARKLHEEGEPHFDKLFYWCCAAEEEALEEYCRGTLAEALFIGTDRTIGSARFVLSNKLSAHMKMPAGDFSIRDWLNDESKGNIFITWKEDQIAVMAPLISSFVDVICNVILSLPEDETRKVWLLTDELASLEKLKGLMPVLTKGRKKGVRVISCLQTISQLNAIWGKEDADTLRGSYRNLVVLGSARADEHTAETLSKSLGDIEVVRDGRSKTSADKGSSETNQERGEKDRLVTAAEISNLGDREGYVAFTRGYPVAKVLIPITDFKMRTEPFVERRALGGNP